MDRVDRALLSLPFLALLDVASTFLMESLGYQLAVYEVGYFARFFVRAQLAYVYAVLYLVLVACFAWVLWYIKNRVLKPSNVADKVLFVLIVCGVCYMCALLVTTVAGNLMLPLILRGGINLFYWSVWWFVATLGTLAFYLRLDVIRYLRFKR
ncbi:MAG: hypothetical protein QXJ02_06330 [Candidatus Bathyarchaeia archaeon]